MVANAQKDANSATINKDYWVKWYEFLKSEEDYYSGQLDGIKMKQIALEAEKSQLEAYLIKNCGGLDVTEPPSESSSNK